MTKQMINVTDITTYLYCPRKIYLKLVKGIKSPPNKAMILGFLKHKIFDIFNKSESAIVSGITQPLVKNQIISLYNDSLKKIIMETSENYNNMMAKFNISSENLSQQTLDFLKKDLNLRSETITKSLSLGYRGKELWRNLKPKYLTEFQIISEDLGLKGRVDRIKLEGEILPYEIKTRDEIYESDKIQLAAYSLLLEEEFGKKIEKGIIETKSKEQEIPITKEMKSQVLEIAEKIRNIKEGGFQNNFQKCKSCGLSENCFG